MISQDNFRKSLVSLFSFESTSPRVSGSNEAVVKAIFSHLERMMGGNNRLDVGATVSVEGSHLSFSSRLSPRTLHWQNATQGVDAKLPFHGRGELDPGLLRVNSASPGSKMAGPAASRSSLGLKTEEYKIFSDQSNANVRAREECESPTSPTIRVLKILQQFAMSADTSGPVHPFIEHVKNADVSESSIYNSDRKSARRSTAPAQQQFHQNQAATRAQQNAELTEKIQRLEEKIDSVENASSARDVVSKMHSTLSDQESRLVRMEWRLNENKDQFSETEHKIAKQELEFDKVKSAMVKTDVMRQATEKVLMTAIEAIHAKVNELKVDVSRDTLLHTDARQEPSSVNASGGEHRASKLDLLPTFDSFDIDQLDQKLQTLNDKQGMQSRQIEELREKNEVLVVQLQEFQSRMNAESPDARDVPIDQMAANDLPEVVSKISSLEMQIAQMPTLFSNQFSEMKLNHEEISQSIAEIKATIEARNADVIRSVSDVVEDLERVKKKELEYQKRASELEQMKRRLKDVEDIVEDSQVAMQKSRNKFEGSLNEVRSSIGDANDFSHKLALQISTNEQALQNLQSRLDSLVESIAAEDVSPASTASPSRLHPDAPFTDEALEQSVKRSSINIVDNRSFEAKLHFRRPHMSNPSLLTADDASIRSTATTAAFEKRMRVLEERHARLRQALKRDDKT